MPGRAGKEVPLALHLPEANSAGFVGFIFLGTASSLGIRRESADREGGERSCGGLEGRGMAVARRLQVIMLTIEHNRIEERSAPAAIQTSPVSLEFPCGLLGFENIKEYRLHAFTDTHPFLWLESQCGNGLCFLVVEPSFVVDSYQIDLPDEDVGFLDLKAPEDAVVLNIATFHPNGAITVNLKGPLVYNRHTLIGRQVVPKNATLLSIKHPLGN